MDTKSVRRKLLRGSLAAPVVLTVSSASASTASFVRCLRNGETDTAGRFFSLDTDSWFRQQVPVAQLWAQGQIQGWFFLDQVKNVYVGVEYPHTQLSFGSMLAPGWKVTEQGTRWALVWFDTATATQYSKISLQRPYGASATTMSCYGSFTKATTA